MLKQDTIQKIESLLKIKGLSEAITSESEADIQIDDSLSVFTDDELKTVKSNSYKDGKKAGVEMEVDDLKKELGLDFQGKTVKGLTEAFKKKVLEDAKIEPNEKVKELEVKLETVQKTAKEYEQKLAEKDSEVSTVKIKTELYKHIPAFGDNAPALDQDDIIDMMQRKGYEFKQEGNKVVAYVNGEKVTNKLGEEVSPKDVVSSFLTEKKLIVPETVPGGRGAGDKRPPARAGSLSELKKQFEDQGKSTLGQEFATAVEVAAKDNKDFKME